jgi:hypothetical protein
MKTIKNPDLRGILFSSQVANDSLKAFINQGKRVSTNNPLMLAKKTTENVKGSVNAITSTDNVVKVNQQLCRDKVDNEPLFSGQPGDKMVRNTESEELREYWEASLPDCGQANCAMDGGCWSCGDQNHFRAQCPARRLGERGRTMVQRAGRSHMSQHKNGSQSGFHKGPPSNPRP